MREAIYQIEGGVGRAQGADDTRALAAQSGKNTRRVKQQVHSASHLCLNKASTAELLVGSNNRDHFSCGSFGRSRKAI